MVRLSTLGSLELRGDDGAVLDALISQSKRVALLVYLAVARAGEMHRRDRLLALFWPELDDRRARDALNQSLHVLRQMVGAKCLVSRGTDEVGVDSRALWCDAMEFQRALDAGQWEEALQLYRGDLLESFHGDCSHAFEEWLDHERERLRSCAGQAARALAEQYERETKYTIAVDFASRALELTADERALRRLMELLQHAGDRVAAIRAYEHFTRRLQDELGLPPSPETQRLAERLRGGEPRFSPTVRPGPPVPPAHGVSGHGLQSAPAWMPSAVAAQLPDFRLPLRPDTYVPKGIVSGDVPGAPHIAGYEIIREIDRGGAAIVYLARELKHGRPVAIKVLKPELTESIQGERFLREIEIIAHLSHPHILSLLDSGCVGSQLYYITPYVVGESLRRRLEGVSACRTPVEEAMRIACEVARALDYAHRQGIVHRDVKPENVLLSEGQAIVADFGIARAMTLADDERMTNSRTMIGTPAYMSPEQCAGEHEVDARSDIYSLGCVLYEMLAGRQPFRGTPSQVIAQHVSAPVPSLREACPLIPFALERAILRALEKDPADRFRTAAEFAAAINDVTARGARWLDAWRAVRRVHRWPVAVRLAAAALVVIVATAGALSTIGTERGSENAALTDLNRIAVLYFDDLTPGAANGHIAAGLTEDLIDELNRVHSLYVISPEGVRPFRGGLLPLDSVVGRFGVGTVVSGSLSSSDSLLRLTVRLTDARTGQQIESETFEHVRHDLFALQDELAVRVTDFLRIRLGREIRVRQQRASTASVQAWELLQTAEVRAERGSAAVRGGNESDARRLLAEADSMFIRASEMDPSWINPILGRASAALSLAFVSTGPGPSNALSQRVATPKVGELSAAWLLRAIELAGWVLERDDSNAEALAIRGTARFWLATLTAHARPDTLLPRAERDLRAALEVRPQFARAWSTLASLYQRQARFTESADAARAALNADAYLTEARTVLSTLFFTTLHTGSFAEAGAWCRRGLEGHPGDPRFTDCELTLLGWTGHTNRDVDAAWAALEAIEGRQPGVSLATTWAYRRMMVAAVLARTGLRDSARSVLARTRDEQTRIPGSTAVPLQEAYVLVLLRDDDAAVEILASHLETSPNDREYLARTPMFRSLHDNARFRALIAGADQEGARRP